MTKLILPLLFAASVAQADVFSHPEADEVVVAGPDLITICYQQEALTCVGPAPGACFQWVCDEVQGSGAREPIYYSLGITTPVRVAGARWAFWRDSNGDLQPMSRYMQ